MSFMQELTSWTYGGVNVDLKPVPEPGQQAPSGSVLKFPRQDGKPAIIYFMRHCGCPFAERDFLSLRTFASSHPTIHCIAISHSSPSHTSTWLNQVGGAGGAGAVELLVDDSRQTHADWGFGPSGWGHVLSYDGFSKLYALGKEKGIWNRPTETGSRWQTGGFAAVDGSGVVRWVRVPEGAQEEPGWEEAEGRLRG